MCGRYALYGPVSRLREAFDAVVDGGEPWWCREGFQAQKEWSVRCWTSFCCVHTTVSKLSKNEKPTALGGFVCLLYAYCDFSRFAEIALSP